MIEPYYKQNGITIYNADCRDVLPDIGDGLTCLLTDPPYGYGWDTNYSRFSKGVYRQERQLQTIRHYAS